MSEQEEKQAEQQEQTRQEQELLSLSEEIKALGKQLAVTAKAFIASEEMQSAKKELSNAFKEVTSELEDAVAKARERDEVQQWQEKAAEVTESWKQGVLQKNIRAEMITALRSVNEQLRGLSMSLQKKAGTKSPEPATPPDATENAAENETPSDQA